MIHRLWFRQGLAFGRRFGYLHITSFWKKTVAFVLGREQHSGSDLKVHYLFYRSSSIRRSDRTDLKIGSNRSKDQIDRIQRSDRTDPMTKESDKLIETRVFISSSFVCLIINTI